jgi:hypothetical protein
LGKKKILFVFFDAGGGHRIVTEAVAAAILGMAHGEFEVEKVEFFEETGFKRLGAITKDLYNRFSSSIHFCTGCITKWGILGSSSTSSIAC